MARELIRKIKFGVGGYDTIEVHCGDTSPESNISAPYGSIYIYTGSATATIYQKRSNASLSTGWFNLTGSATPTVKGLVNQAATDANSTATDIAGLVTDFNDLLSKLRTAGIIAP